MKIGYPCINRTLECKGTKTFRLKSYSEERLIQTVTNNLNCLLKILQFNRENNINFFRISSDIVPFASHPVCTYDWQNHFKAKFKEIGDFIKENNFRISMHPDQFVLINSLRDDVIENSIKELIYHTQMMNLMELDQTAKIQIHVGGVYGDKEKSSERFIKNYNTLPLSVKQRLVIENDDRLYSLHDCLHIYQHTGIPVLFDCFHHSILNNGESFEEAFEKSTETWKEKDGIPMMDYSSQEPNARIGKHAETIDESDFKNFLKFCGECDFDIMLEIKDKEKSAVKAIAIAEKMEYNL